MPEANHNVSFKSLERRWFGVALWLWLGVTAVYALFAPGRIDIVDGAIRFAVTDSLWESGRPVVNHPWLHAVIGRDGRPYAYYGLGTSLAALPLVALADLLSAGSMESKRFAFSLTSVPYASAAVAAVFLIYGRLGFSLRRALAWSLVLAFGTLLWPYAGSSFDSALQAFWLTVAAWVTIEAARAPSAGWGAMGALAAVMLINIQEYYFVLVGACLIAVPKLERSAIVERMKNPALQLIACGVGLGLALFAGYNIYRFGKPLYSGRTTVGHALVGNPLIGLAGLFVSPAKSIFLYSPPYLLALIGLYRLVRHRTAIGLPIAATMAAHIALTSMLAFWAGEWAWGPRYLVAQLPLAAVAAPFAFGSQEQRPLKLLLAGLGLVVQMLALTVDHQRYYFERNYEPHFWTDDIVMYTDSPLVARVGEVCALLREANSVELEAFVPGPEPLSMTASIFGPPPELLRAGGGPAWLRRYMVFTSPRPWTLWSSLLPASLRPCDPFLVAPLLLALAVGSALAILRKLRLDATKDEQVVQA